MLIENRFNCSLQSDTRKFNMREGFENWEIHNFFSSLMMSRKKKWSPPFDQAPSIFSEVVHKHTKLWNFWMNLRNVFLFLSIFLCDLLPLTDYHLVVVSTVLYECVCDDFVIFTLLLRSFLDELQCSIVIIFLYAKLYFLLSLFFSYFI